MKYTQTHEWIRLNQGEEGIATVGISDHAQKELGEIVFVQLPKVGQKLEAGAESAVLESTKAASDIYSPVAGEVIEVNQQLLEDPSLLNTSAEDKGWLYKIVVYDLAALDTLLEDPLI